MLKHIDFLQSLAEIELLQFSEPLESVLLFVSSDGEELYFSSSYSDVEGL